MLTGYAIGVMAVIVLVGFLVAALAPPLLRRAPGAGPWVLAIYPGAATLYFVSKVWEISGGSVIIESYAWAPSLYIHFSFHLDGLSLLFALLISGIGTLIVIYAGRYLAGHERLGRFYLYLIGFMASMLGVVLADNLLVLFIFWELTSISSFFLIGFERERESARHGALQAMLVTVLGGLALLPGLLLLWLAGGSLELSVLLAQGAITDPLLVPLFLLILLGAFTKSAQFPFHFWLPSAMEAPTPVSAYLHSSTMVKAGVYLLARLHPVLGEMDLWFWLLTGFGAVTMVLTAYMAIQETHLKRLLAYSTVSALGVMTFLLGIGTYLSVTAAVVFLAAHALYKGSLFMVAGIVLHETGESHLDRLSGLQRVMPITAVAGFLAAFSMAGFPPFFGFIAKETLYGATLGTPEWEWLLTMPAVLTSVFLVAVAGLAGIRPFVGSRPVPSGVHEATPPLWIGPITLAVVGLLFGIFPGLVGVLVVGPAVGAVMGDAVVANLELWHGFSPEFVIGFLGLAWGIGIYFAAGRIRQAHLRLAWVSERGPARWYEASLDGLNLVATGVTRLFQSGYLRVYIAFILATTFGVVGYTLLTHGRVTIQLDALPFLYEIGIGALILFAAIATVASRSRLGVIVALGTVGYTMALVYALFGAPDLAITQFVIETLTVILFVLVLYRLPDFVVLSSRPIQIFEVAIAVAVGLLVAVLVALTIGTQYYPPISDYYVESSLPLAHGRNVVNTILVDFRALDTLGEITVLAVAGLGIYALIRLKPGSTK